jgi:hypothetical protein
MAVALYAPQGRWWLDTSEGRFPLPEWVSYRVQVPRTGVGGFNLTLPRSGPNVATLMADPYASITFEVMADSGAWIEPPQARFLPLQRTYNSATGTVAITGAGLGWLTGRIVRGPYLFDDVNGKITFTNRTAGYILRWLWNDQVRRRAVVGITPDFDNVTDSNGEPWAETFTLAYERGVTLRQVLDGFASDGVVWRMSGASWQAAQGAFDDEPSDIPTLYDGIDVQADQVSISMEEVAGSVLAIGGAGEVARSEVATTPRWGRWEVAQSHGDTTGAALARLALAERLRRGLVKESATVTLLPSARYRPFQTVFPGQTVTVRFEAPPGFAGRWDVARWDSGQWGGPPRWWESQTGRIEEIVIADDGRASTVSLQIGEHVGSPDDLVRTTVSALTGGVIVRGTATGRA